MASCRRIITRSRHAWRGFWALIVLISTPAWATPQMPDRIIVDGGPLQTISLASNDPMVTAAQTNPAMRQYLSENFKPACTGLMRALLATWAIERDTLYLVKLSRGCGSDVPVALSNLFPGAGERVPAVWFSGTLFIAPVDNGAPFQQVAGDYQRLNFSAGHVISKSITKAPAPPCEFMMCVGGMVYFAPESVAITADGAAQISKIATWLTVFPKDPLTILGFCDVREAQLEGANCVKLSRRRAEAVKQRLIAEGIDALRLRAVPQGRVGVAGTQVSDEQMQLMRRVQTQPY